MFFNKILNYSNCNNSNYKSLLSRCKSGYAVPYIGSGMSIFAGFPTWMDLLEKLRNECDNKNFPLDNPFKATDEIEKNIGQKKLYDFLKLYFHYEKKAQWWIDLIKEKNIHQQAISVIPQLFNGPIITSNYEKIIEAAHGFNLEVVLPNSIEKLMQANNEIKHILFKVHGCISDPEHMVFTGKSYNTYYGNEDHIKVLSSFFKRFNFIFLGCSLNISDNADLPIELWKTLVASDQIHYAILPCSKDNIGKRQNELEAINIRPIFYPEGKHECVKIILEELLKEKKKSLSIPEYDNEKYPFVGRSEILEQIKENVERFNITSISGIGGIGKTRIACEYANQNRSDYYSGIYFFHAVSEENIYAEILQFAIEKGLINESWIDTPEYIWEKIRIWMSENSNWMFILDNVENYHHIDNLVSIFYAIPPKKHRHILVTTRNNDIQLVNIPIKSFSGIESTEFFFKFIGKKTDRYAKKIMDALGHLPLAMEQSASYIKKFNISYKEYYNLLNKKGVLETLRQGDHTDESLAVGATFNLSIERINSQDAKIILGLCSYFASDNIKCEWITNSAKCFKEYPSVYEIILNKDGLKSLIKELESYSLIRVNDGKISMHRLTQTVVRGVLQDDAVAKICLSIMVNEFDIKNFDTNKAKQIFLETIPHIEQFFWICEHEYTMNYTEPLSKLYHIYMYGYDKIKEHNIALKYKDITIEMRETLCNEKDIAKTYNLIGVVYQNSGKYYQSLVFLEKALLLRQKVFSESGLPEDESLIARTYNNIALNYFWLCKYDLAEKFHMQAIKIKEKVGDDDDTAYSYNNIGALFEAKSKYDNFMAMQYHKRALDIRIIRQNDVNKAYTLNNIGVVEKNQGNYKDALLHFYKALELRENVYGVDGANPEIAQTCTNIAEILINKDKLEQAKEMLDRAIRIYEAKLGERQIETSRAYYNLAKWYYVQDNFTEAQKWFRKVLDIRKLYSNYNNEVELKYLEQMIEKCSKPLFFQKGKKFNKI